MSTWAPAFAGDHAEGLTEAIAIAKGETPPPRLFVPPAVDVHGIRAKLGLTQDAFATSFGFTVSQIREWEQGRNRPAGAVRAYLMIIDAYPERVREMLRDAGERAAA